jgi:hypothetical protein
MTKINKKNIISNYKDILEQRGFTFLDDNFTIANGLFYKKISSDLILLLGFTISNYSNGYTADFYLSKVFEFGYMLKGFPRNAYERISFFLTDDERKVLLRDSEWILDGIKDAWWNSLDNDSINSFMGVLEISEKRFYEQEGLTDLRVSLKTIFRAF